MIGIEQLIEKPETELTPGETQSLIAHYEQMSAKYTAYEQAVKVTLNSIYGAFGNKWFHFFDIEIAESITLQGQSAILYSEKILNKYFQEFWPKDTAAHEHLNINVKGRLVRPSVVYIDTDSCYVQFEEMYESIEWLGEKMAIDKFIMELYNFRIKDYITKCMAKYAETTNTDNFLYFDMETIAYSGIWLAKKKYLQNIAWEDKLDEDDRYPSLKKIKTIGFDTIQSSTPALARKHLTEALQLVLSEKPTAALLKKLVDYLKKCKKEFKLADIDQIAFNKRTNNIEKYIVDDTIEFQIGLKCPPNVKAAGFYNFLMNTNPKYKNKYKMIGNGEKLKLYHCKTTTSDMFAYMPGDHPYEIAPEVDYEIQFEKSVIDPLNRVLKACSLQTLNRNLIYSTSLF
jgi:DNA polymerase elongation subunit (family B)|tara:strand:+ start:2271 stop:3470 length:1200 start_codon:yes stop_codon:yes gene_type:complete